MKTLSDIEKEVITALKAGDRTRLDILRMLVNQIKVTAKNDGNREPTADDVITAGNKMIKQAKETRSFLAPDTGGHTVVISSEKANAVRALDNEIKIVGEFLPQKMDRDILVTLIKTSLIDAPEGKAARGHVMKELNGKYRGQFDSKEATDILTGMLA